MRQKLPQLILSLGAGVLGIAVVTALFAAAGPNAPAGSELSAAEIGRLHGWGGARAGALSEGLFWLLGVVLVGAAFAGYAVGRGRAVRHLFAAGSVAVLAGVGLVLFSGQPAASAKSDYPDELPNGSAVFAGATFGCDMCHGYSGTSRLSSGTPGYLASLLKPFSTNTAWGGHGGTSTAVTTDIDGDGFSSGEELQDPTGSWVYNAGNNVFNDAAFVSNPNLNTDYPPAPQITAIGGITGGQVISGSLVVSAAIRYAGLSRVVFRLTGPGGAEAYSSTVAYTATDYADPYCMGSSPGSCAPWNSALVANGLYTLTVTATDKLSAGLGGPQTGSLARTMIRVSNTVTAANLSVVKRAARDPAPLDAPLTYTLYLTNTGPDPATGVVLTDTLPPGLLFASAVPTCTLAGSDVVCAAGALGVNAAFSVTVLVTPTAAGTATNVARAAANELDPDPGNNIYTETAFITTPNLALGKRASPDAVPLGQPITYTLNVTNRGPGAVLSVTLTDTLPTGVNLASVTPPAPACVPSGGDVICTLGSLAGGASATVTLRVTPTVRGVITNTARVGGFPADQHPADNTASAATLVGVADLSVSKVDSADPAPAGSVATYTITVRNLGPDTASGVVVTDTLPPGTPPLAFSDPPCVLAGNELGCTLGTLAPQATRTLTVTVQPAATGTITNSVRVAGVEPDPNPANNSAAQPTTFSTPDLSVEKRAAVILVPPGRPLTYTLTVANLGPGPASGVVLTDTLPPGVLFSQAVPGAPTCVEAGGRVTCSLGSMPAGDARQITIVVTPTAAAAITNTAAVASDRPDSDPANNTAAATVLVEAPASLPYVYSASKDDALLRVINPADGATVSTVRVKVAGGTVQQINGLATNPATGDMWALLKLHGQSTRELAIINPVTGRATRIGDTGPGRFSTIAFNPAGTVLFGVTGDGSPLDSQTLFTLSLTNAAPSKVMPLGNGNEGEAIAFNADNGLLYHASGYGPQNDSLKGEIFEAVNVTAQTITTITLWGDDYFGSNALLYMGQGNFLLADCGQGGNDSCASPWFSGLYRLSTGGAAIFLAQLDHLSKGLAPGADLSLRLRDSVDPLLMGTGTPLTYTVMVTNAGFLDAAGVVLTGALPSGAEVNVRQAGSWACAAGGNHFTCTLPSLATGATATVTLAATPTAVGTLTHTVGVTAATPDPNPANSWAAEATAVTSKDLSITKQDSGDPATVGQPLTYTIIIANHGPGAMTGLVMTDTLPPAVLFNAWASDRFACLETGGVVNCNLGALAEGASSVITIVVTPTLTTTIVNTAAVRGSEFEADRANNTAVETTVIWEGEARVYLPLIVKEL